METSVKRYTVIQSTINHGTVRFVDRASRYNLCK